ncbi:MAG TPA: class I SAM-dependent methyltransferase [Actinomycetes bacterium]|nr:class I SAM-dependent methyltransferase [Actinomycetes bacterium]
MTAHGTPDATGPGAPGAAGAPEGFGPCRICRAPLSRTVVDLGVQPLADDFPTAEELARGEPSWPLRVVVCTRCWLVQLAHFEGAQEILAAHAHASSSFSETLLAHGRAWADEVVERFGLGPASLVVEGESNDGYLLRGFADRGVRVLGFDHLAANAQAARRLGVPTGHERFGLATARRLAAEGRRADVLVGNHNLANADDLNEAAEALRTALAPGGVVALEFHHALELVRQAQFDVVSHSHCNYLSLLALRRVLADHGLTLLDARTVDVHGGSVRAYAVHADRAPGAPPPGVGEVLALERAAGLDTLAAYEGFGVRVDTVRRDLLGYLRDARGQGRRVVAYGAPSKGNTLLNACGISTGLLPWTVDRSPAKHGRFLPGSHLAVHPPERILAERPDDVLILPWSLAGEITRQLAPVRSWGGRFVVAMPRLAVLP